MKHSDQQVRRQLRRDLNRLVRDYCDYRLKHKYYGQAWNTLYEQFKEKFGVDLQELAKQASEHSKKRKGPLDIACETPVEEHGLDLMVELFALAVELFGEERDQQDHPQTVLDC